MNDIEKCAKLMGLKLAESLTKEKPHFHPCGSLYVWRTDMPELIMPRWFNPLTNKPDLMDLECAIGIDITWLMTGASASNYDDGAFQVDSYFADHPDKFTARAHAVMAVVEQIYDRREG